MPMQLDTRNREAFELVSEALGFIDQYRESRDVGRLKDATLRLTTARERDPNYFRARYYDAIVDDLSGQFRSAVQKLTSLLGESPLLANEVRYNLGLAEYHNYNHSALERAIEQFKLVLISAKDQSLRLRAQAGLAQAYAMHMIPREYDKPDLKQIEEYRELAFLSVSQVFRELWITRFQRLIPFRKRSMNSVTIAEIRWTAHNAKGMALMYYADYLPQICRLAENRGRQRQAAAARTALSELTRAEKITPQDWANRCDLASANMRLGYFTGESRYFEVALKTLQDVIDRLRPGYGFAIYETGRVLRVMGEFEKAIERFDAAQRIAEADRDVSDRRINSERQRVQRMDKTFP